MKKLVSLTLCLVMLLGLVPVQSTAADGADLANAEFVYFGSVGGVELIWQVVGIEDNCAILLNANPVMTGEYDNSIHTYYKAYSIWGDQVYYGSASWRHSDLRTYLNSGAEDVVYEDVVFDYSTFAQGTGGSQNNDVNPPSYGNQVGFLHSDNFEEVEVALIEPTVHRSLVSYLDPQNEGGGSLAQGSDFGSDYEKAAALYSGNYAYTTTKDYVYPFSAQEYNQYIYNNPSLEVHGGWDDETYYWLRDHMLSVASAMFTITRIGTTMCVVRTNDGFAYTNGLEADESARIRPACRINLDYVTDLTGAGTYEDPYRMTIDESVLSRPEYTQGSVYRTHPTHLTLTVYKNRNLQEEGAQERNVLCKGATVEVGDVTYTTDENGRVTVPYPRAGATVSYEGYCSRFISGAKLEESPEIYLQRDNGKPVIHAVWVDNVDVLHKELHLDLINSGTQTVTVETSVADAQVESLELVQGTQGVTLKPSSGNRVTWSDHFDVSKAVYVVLKDKDGRENRQKLQLKVDTITAEELEGYSYSFGDELSFTLPEEAGEFLAGTKINVGAYVPIQFKYTIEDGKFYSVFGIQIDIDEKDGVTSVKKTNNIIKDTIEGAKKGLKNYQDIRNFMKNQKLGTAAAEMDFGVKGHGELLGFMEGYCTSEGKLVILDSGLILSGGADATWTQPFVVGAIPCFLEVGFGAELAMTADTYMNAQYKKLSPYGKFQFDLTGKFGVGAGVKELASVTVGAKATLSHLWKFYDERPTEYTLTGTVKPYLKGNLLIFEVEPEFKELYNEVLYSYPEQKSVRSMEALTDFDLSDLYDAGEYQMAELGELAPVWGGETRGTNWSLLSGAYDYADPQLTRMDNGDLLMVFLSKNPEAADQNCIQLYSSVCKDGVWQEPQLILDDGTMDASPQLVTANGKTCVTWLNYSKLGSDTTLTEAMQTGTVALAVLQEDGTAKVVREVQRDGQTIHTMPALAVGSEADIFWTVNDGADVFGTEGSYIYHGSYDFGSNMTIPTGTELGGAKTDGMVVSLAADTDGVRTHYAMAVDTDGDVNTMDDIEIFVDGEQHTDNSVADSGLQYVNHVLYWYSDGKLMADGEAVFTCEGFNDRFAILDENGTKCVVFAKNGDLCNTLCAAWCVDGVWGEPVALTDGKNYIADFSAAFDKNGDLSVAYVCYDVDETADVPYGEAYLRELTAERAVDLALTEVYFDGSTYVQGRDLVFDLTVENLGALPTENVLVELLDAEDTVLAEKTCETTLYSGQKTELTVGLRVPEAVQGQTYTLRVTPVNAGELETENNAQTVSVSWDDLALEQVSWGYRDDGKAVLYADVVNRGYSAYESATVELRKGSDDGEPVDTFTVGALDSFDAAGVAFTLTPEEGAVYYLCIVNEDDHLGNNSDFVILNETLNEPNPDPDPDQPCDGGENCPARQYTDVDTNAWYHAGIDFALEYGMMNGVAPDTFRPNGTMTRAMLVTVLWRYEEEPKEGVNVFADVLEGQWYTQAVAWAAENGIVTGVAPTRFNPDGSITREQMAAILYRYATKLGVDTSKRAELTAFPDAGSVSGYAVEPLQWCVAEGIIGGSDGKLLPQGSATRAQVATILMRFIKNVVNE